MKMCIICVSVYFWILLLFSGCNIYTADTIRFDFVETPRLIYIANIDTELDFSNATLIRRNLHDSSLGEEFPLSQVINDVVIEHYIDFTTAGSYMVKVAYYTNSSRFPIFFFISVVDEYSFNQLKDMR